MTTQNTRIDGLLSAVVAIAEITGPMPIDGMTDQTWRMIFKINKRILELAAIEADREYSSFTEGDAMSRATKEIDEMIRLRATRAPSINQMQEWRAEIGRLHSALRGATDYLDCIDKAHPDLVVSVHGLFPIKEMVERYRAALDNQSLPQKEKP